MFSSVPESQRDSAAVVKSLLVMAVTVVDDVADKLHDGALLNELLRLLEPGLYRDMIDTNSRHPATSLTATLLEAVFSRLNQAPNWDAIRPYFHFDLKQVWNAFGYSYLTNTHPHFINFTESKAYHGHNMMFLVFGDIDLAYSQMIAEHEIGAMREAMWTAQQMARIGNWVSTWERELNERDYSSGVVSLALSQGILTTFELQDSGQTDAMIERLRQSGVEQQLFDQWVVLGRSLIGMQDQISSVSIPDYVAGIEFLMIHHLSSRGLK